MFKAFRPEYEAQADSDAVAWMLAAQYDARQLASLPVAVEFKAESDSRLDQHATKLPALASQSRFAGSSSAQAV